jgi:hypothetical protein
MNRSTSKIIGAALIFITLGGGAAVAYRDAAGHLPSRRISTVRQLHSRRPARSSHACVAMKLG